MLNIKKGEQQDVMLENKGLTDINPLICGQHRCAAGHSFGPAVREYYLLHYVLYGTGVFYTGGKKYNVAAGDMFVIRPNESTVYRASKKDPWHYIWLGFETTLNTKDILSEDVIHAPECAHIFREAVEEARGGGNREWEICGRIYRLFSRLEAHTRPKQANSYVKLAEDYIHANYMQDIRVDTLAKSLGLDRSYFCRIFKQQTGKPPRQYIVDFRLQKAAALITAQGLSPGEAAAQVGYKDPVNFSRMFSRRFGVPPGRYGRM